MHETAGLGRGEPPSVASGSGSRRFRLRGGSDVPSHRPAKERRPPGGPGARIATRRSTRWGGPDWNASGGKGCGGPRRPDYRTACRKGHTSTDWPAPSAGSRPMRPSEWTDALSPCGAPVGPVRRTKRGNEGRCRAPGSPPCVGRLLRPGGSSTFVQRTAGSRRSGPPARKLFSRSSSNGPRCRKASTLS